MPTPIPYPVVTDIPALLRSLELAVLEATGVRDVIEGPGRVTSRTAKNVEIGMEVEFPGHGWKVVHGISKDGDRVLLSNGGHAFYPAGADQRVRTRRPA